MPLIDHNQKILRISFSSLLFSSLRNGKQRRRRRRRGEEGPLFTVVVEGFGLVWNDWEG